MEDIMEQEQPTVDAVEEEVVEPQEVDNEDLEEGGNDPAPAKQEQDPQINAKFAEMRRKIEDAERKERDRNSWVEQNYGKQGIHTWDEYQSMIERQKERDYYEEQGVDPDVVEEIVNKKLNNHPSVLAARQREQEAWKSTQMDSLNKTYGLNLQTVEDIQSLPNAEEMIKRIAAGYDWADAYLVTHRDHINQNIASKAKQSALNNQQSKSHLKTSKGGADVDTFTPDPDVMKNYRQMFRKELRTGKMTEADLIKHYRKSIGK